MEIKQFFIKNWKSIVFILVIAGLLLFNVKQYQASQAIVRDNIAINAKYQALLEKEVIYNEQIGQYKTQIEEKDAVIAVDKNKIEKTEAKLQTSQDEARRLSAKVKMLSTAPDSLQTYVDVCDSLAIVAPILADQVDTLKRQNKDLVETMKEKSVLQDNVIARKDVIINETKTVLANAMDSYNKATDKLVSAENKLNKERTRKTFWKKAAIVLGLGLGVMIATK